MASFSVFGLGIRCKSWIYIRRLANTKWNIRHFKRELRVWILTSFYEYMADAWGVFFNNFFTLAKIWRTFYSVGYICTTFYLFLRVFLLLLEIFFPFDAICAIYEFNYLIPLLNCFTFYIILLYLFITIRISFI